MNRTVAAAVAVAGLAFASAAGAAEVYNQPLTTPSDDAVSPEIAQAMGPAAAGLENLYHLAAAVPEPMTWTMMIVGFGAAGQILRRRRALGHL